MENGKDARKRIFTIPNLLSVIRLLMLPVIVYLYVFRHDVWGAAIVLVISAVTDIVDGWIARHFNQVSDLGKILDPIADKLTQFTMLCCLVTTWPNMILPVAMLFIKEIADSITSLWVIRRTGTVLSAEWHGKLATVIVHSTVVIHVIWRAIPPVLSDILIGMSVGTMLLSLIMYSIRNARYVKAHGGERKTA